ncbi:MAG TPA: signal peptidase I [Acidimicrobiales bacterium]
MRRVITWGIAAGLAVSLLVMWHGGYQPYVVHTGSMTPTLNPGDLVIDHPTAQVRQGDVVTFGVSSGHDGVVTHRVANVDGDHIQTKGDANATPDSGSISRTDIRGTAVRALPYAGYVVVYLQQPAGIASVITVLLSLTLAWGLFFASEVPAVAPLVAGIE